MPCCNPSRWRPACRDAGRHCERPEPCRRRHGRRRAACRPLRARRRSRPRAMPPKDRTASASASEPARSLQPARLRPIVRDRLPPDALADVGRAVGDVIENALRHRLIVHLASSSVEFPCRVRRDHTPGSSADVQSECVARMQHAETIDTEDDPEPPAMASIEPKCRGYLRVSAFSSFGSEFLCVRLSSKSISRTSTAVVASALRAHRPPGRWPAAGRGRRR